jgi:hypothetical protein
MDGARMKDMETKDERWTIDDEADVEEWRTTIFTSKRLISATYRYQR